MRVRVRVKVRVRVRVHLAAEGGSRLRLLAALAVVAVSRAAAAARRGWLRWQCYGQVVHGSSTGLLVCLMGMERGRWAMGGRPGTRHGFLPCTPPQGQHGPQPPPRRVAASTT